MSLALHQCIDRFNILKKPTEKINDYLYEHKNLYKVVMIANHLFRTLAMVALMVYLPFVWPVNLAICFAGSLFYRLTVENNCAYKFALPAFFGSVAFMIAKTAFTSALAIGSAGAYALAAASLLPVAGYLTYIVLTVNYDIDNK